MKTIGIFLGIVLALALLVVLSEGILYGTGLLFGNFEAFNSLDATTRMVLIFASCLLLLCTFVLSNAIKGHRKHNDKVVQPEKMMIYARLIELWGANESDYLLDQTALDQMRKPMTLWAGDAVLKRFMKLCSQMDAKESAAVYNKHAEGLLAEIRRDLGNSNDGIIFTDWQGFLSIKDPERQAAIRESIAAMHARQD